MWLFQNLFNPVNPGFFYKEVFRESASANLLKRFFYGFKLTEQPFIIYLEVLFNTF